MTCRIIQSHAALYSFLAGGSQLPSSWNKPVIDSVLLPVHAVVSECTIEALVIPAPPTECDSSTDLLRSFHYTIDDSDPCLLAYTLRQDEEFLPVPESNAFAVTYYIEEEFGSGHGSERLRIFQPGGDVVVDASRSFRGITPCGDNPFPISLPGGDFSFTLQGQSGTEIVVSGSATATIDGITFESITLTPK